MAWELLITSAPRGLKPGSSGFCPVLATRGIPPNLIERLEALSGYRHVEIGGQSHRNPVVYSHTIIRLGGDTYHILSRIADAGRDYSGRSNKLAHHVVLRPRECPSGGPVALLSAPNLMREFWEGSPGWLDAEPAIPQVTTAPGPCHLWQKVWGDAGWGGVLGHRVLTKPEDPLYFVYPDTVNMLGLLAEAVALLPESYRWRVTFTTHDLGLADAAQCRWRAAPASSPEAVQWRKTRGLEIWDLTRPRGMAPDGPSARAGREGRALFLSEQTSSHPVRQKATTPTLTATPAVSPPPELPPPLVPLEGETYAIRSSQLSPPQLARGKGGLPQKARSPWQFWKGFGAGVACTLLLLGIVMIGFRGSSLPQLLEPVHHLVFGKSQSAPATPQDTDKKPVNQLHAGESAQQDKTPETTEKKENTPKNASQKQVREEKEVPAGQDAGKQISTTPEGIQTEAKTVEQPPQDAGPTVPPPAQDSAQSTQESRARPNPVGPPEPPQGGDHPHSRSPVDFLPDEARPIGESPYRDITSLALLMENRDQRGLAQLGTQERISLVSASNKPAILRVQKKEGQVEYYLLSSGYPEEHSVVIGDRKSLIKLPWPGVLFQIKPEQGWEGQKQGEFLYKKNDKPLLSLKIANRPAGVSITAETTTGQSAEGQEQSLPDELIAKLGCFFDDPIEPTKKIWITLVNLKIVKPDEVK